MSYKFSREIDPFALVENAIQRFEADEENKEPAPEESEKPSNIEIAPPPESTQKNSDFFTNGKIKNSTLETDPAVHNLTKIISASMQDDTTIRPYVDAFFTSLGINDIDPNNFKIFSGEIWEKLEELTELDAETSLAEFQTWVRGKISQYNT